MLGVPTVADRAAQTAVKFWLEPKLDPLFHKDPYGYRPGRSAHDALAVIKRRCWEYDWVVEFDIKGLRGHVIAAAAPPICVRHRHQPTVSNSLAGPQRLTPNIASRLIL